MALINRHKKLLTGSFFGLSMFLAAGFIFAPMAFAADTTAPTIFDEVMNKNFYSHYHQVDFSWTTDEKTTGKVEYGMSSGNYTESLSDQTSDITHSASITALQLGQTYYFRIGAVDLSGNAAYSKEYIYTTPPKEINVEKIKVLDIGSDSAIIQVQLNRNSGFTISYGELSGNYTKTLGEPYPVQNRTPNYFIDGTPESLSRSQNTRTSVVLVGDLKPETKYYAVITTLNPYIDRITGAAQLEVVTSTSDEFTFTTTGLPEVTNVTPIKADIGSIVTIKGKNFGNNINLPSPDQVSPGQSLLISSGCHISASSTDEVAPGSAPGWYTSCLAVDIPWTNSLAEIISWTNTEIQFRVTKNLKTGPVYIIKGYIGSICEGTVCKGSSGHRYTAFAIRGPEVGDKVKKQNVYSNLKLTVNSNKANPIITKEYGCNFSTTSQKAKSRTAKNIRVVKLFKKGDDADSYLRSVNDLYKINWKRSPRCDELQTRLDNKISIKKLVAWLKKNKPTK